MRAAAPSGDTVSPDQPLTTAALGRRMACFLYEGVLLFGVLMLAGLLYGTVTGQRHALLGRHGLQAFLFVVLAVYFTWFWSHGGQTLAMKTWRIRVLRADGTPLSTAHALLRYLLGWLWFAPALLTLWWTGAASVGPIFATLATGIVGYACLARLRPDRQFWHDVAAGTRLVHWQPEVPARR